MSEIEQTEPSVSAGILSATNRIWGKAIQTDAKISPANYGGALVDLAGRVQGVLVPLSPNHREDAAGVEWYDSGIGFAIPVDDVNRIVPQLITDGKIKVRKLITEKANAPTMPARI